jgi:hypothetical protein
MNLHRQLKNEFLVGLRRECELRFEAGVADSILSEVEDHLDAGIQARLELGESLDEAERNAVANFSTIEHYGASMGSVYRDKSKFDRPLFLLGVCFIYWSVAFVELPFHLFMISIWWGILVSIALRSGKLACFKWGTLRNLAILTFFTSIFFSVQVVNLWSYGGMGFVNSSYLKNEVRTVQAKRMNRS